jgi:hypothetical protein
MVNRVWLVFCVYPDWFLTPSGGSEIAFIKKTKLVFSYINIKKIKKQFQSTNMTGLI